MDKIMMSPYLTHGVVNYLAETAFLNKIN